MASRASKRFIYKVKAKGFGKTMKMVGYGLPKTILRRTFTNANVTDYFPKKKKKK